MEKCEGCSLCLDYCPAGAIAVAAGHSSRIAASSSSARRPHIPQEYAPARASTTPCSASKIVSAEEGRGEEEAKTQAGATEEVGEGQGRGQKGNTKTKTAVIDPEVCIGCGACIVVCPAGAVRIKWDQGYDTFQKKMVEHAAGALVGKGGRVFFLNFLAQVTSVCDCFPGGDAPIVRDIGILASLDPVALDAASAELVNAEASLPGCAIKKVLPPGADKFRAVHPEADWNVQLDHAVRMGMGERTYRLVKV